MPENIKTTIIACTVILALCISGATYCLYKALEDIAWEGRLIKDSIGYVSDSIGEINNQLSELKGLQSSLKEIQSDVSSLHIYLDGIEKAISSLHLDGIERAISNLYLYR